MAHLKSVEDIQSGATLATFIAPGHVGPIQPVGEMGWSHRNATFTIANIAYGASPFGMTAAPLAPRKWPWQVRTFGRMGWDAARDALATAIGVGVPVRLVYVHDAGYERVVNAVAYDVGMPFSAQADTYWDFKVVWELLGHWTERRPVDATLRMGQGLRMGQLPANRMGQGSSTQTITAATFNVPTGMVDASLAGPGGVPNQPDTGPVITITGPYGGSLGFSVTNLSDRYHAFFNFTLPILAGHKLVIDCGAWSAIYDSIFDNSGYLSVASTQPYMMAITAGVANQIRLDCAGTAPSFGGTVNITWSRLFL